MHARLPVTRDVKVHPVRTVDGRRVASVAFPVAGTSIVHSGLYGKWRLEAALDGAERRICGPAHFFLRDR